MNRYYIGEMGDSKGFDFPDALGGLGSTSDASLASSYAWEVPKLGRLFP